MRRARKARGRIDRGGLNCFCWCDAWLALGLRMGEAPQRIEEGQTTYQLASQGVLQVDTHFLKSYGWFGRRKFYVRCDCKFARKRRRGARMRAAGPGARGAPWATQCDDGDAVQRGQRQIQQRFWLLAGGLCRRGRRRGAPGLVEVGVEL